MNSSLRIIGFALCCAASWCVPAALAHESGDSLEQESGPYLVDIGYDPYPLLPGQPATFSALLIKNAGTLQWSYAPYTAVTIEIVSPDGERSTYERTVEPPVPASVEHTFAAAGTYTLSARYRDQAGEMARATFSLTVAEPVLTGPDWRIAVIGIVLVCGTTFGLSLLFTRHERRSA